MLTFALSFVSTDELGPAPPDSSAFAVSRGAGGGRGGLMVGAAGMLALGLCALEADFGLGAPLAGASRVSYGLMAAGIWMFAEPPWVDFAAGAGAGPPGNPSLSGGPPIPGGRRSPNASPRVASAGP